MWLFVLLPAFVVGAFGILVGLVSYGWSATIGPTALLAGLVALFGPSVLTSLGLVAPVDDPTYFVLVPLVVTGAVYLGLHALQCALRQISSSEEQ